ncbi:hypothetical protein EBI_25568 [Enterocytozoon bieneusi H348]|nr:hypothetical protein EBI_25568 [Enterocytozoon bieneusi H348]|eukprot:XP_001828097.1 hypothetical protein EBI_25568 [Enterocytozoon bieneusi H348]
MLRNLIQTSWVTIVLFFFKYLLINLNNYKMFKTKIIVLFFNKINFTILIYYMFYLFCLFMK